jgi:hypothetical protein
MLSGCNAEHGKGVPLDARSAALGRSSPLDFQRLPDVRDFRPALVFVARSTTLKVTG